MEGEAVIVQLEDSPNGGGSCRHVEISELTVGFFFLILTRWIFEDLSGLKNPVKIG